MTHTCPRRMTEHGPWKREEGLDDFKAGHGIIGQPRGCTFCGSMSQEDFLQAIRDGAEIGPSDKSYKFYVEGIERDGDPNDMRVVGSSSSPTSGWRPWKDLTRAERKAVKAQSSYPADPKTGHYMLKPWGPTVGGKFYTHHLTDQALVDEFDTLWGEHKIRWGYPGAPYVRLYLPTLPTRLQQQPAEGLTPGHSDPLPDTGSAEPVMGRPPTQVVFAQPPPTETKGRS